MTCNTQKGLATSTLLFLLLSVLLGAGSVAAHQQSTSELLLPYFEVDLTGTGVKTIFSVVNSSIDPVDVEVTVHTNWGIEVLSSTFEIAGDAAHTADLGNWLIEGRLPDRTLGAGELEHVRAALSGQASPLDDLYYSSELAIDLAVGYVKIRRRGGPGPRHDVLFGEYFVLNAPQDFAEGDFLIPIDKSASCPGLCQRHGVRFLSGGGFDSGTEVVVWSELAGKPSADPLFAEAEKIVADAIAFRQDGLQIDRMGLGLLPLQVIRVSELGLSAPFGWIDLFTEEDVHISLRLAASNRFSVGFQAFCLPPRPPSSSLTLIKHVINDDGGSSTPGDFQLYVDNRRVSNGVATSLRPGNYTASEINLPGYTAGTWGGDCDADGFVSLAEGEHKVCEITNDDDPQATLTLIKHVIGGTLGVADFPLFIDGQQVASGAVTTIAPGTYTASEQNRPNYQAEPWVGDCNAAGEITLAAGEHKVCEITNRRFDSPTPPRLTLVKVVINDDGGTLGVHDFPLFVGSELVSSGEASEFAAGTYFAGEQNQPGYTAGSWTGDCAPNGQVTLVDGDDKTCTITNDDDPTTPTYLTLVKQVINDDGGTLGVHDFPLFVSGQPVTSGVAIEVTPGTYIATEQNQDGYDPGPWTGACAPNGEVTLAEGDNKTCVITNDDHIDPPMAYLTLVKQVVNDDGGSLGVADFPLFVGSQQVTSGVAIAVAPGTYTASEQNQAGYAPGPWTGACSADGVVTLAEGESKTCVITNDDMTEPMAYLTLVKQVINDDGGTLGPHDFPLFIDGQQVTSGVAVQVAPGTYTASEQNQPGYIAGSWTGACSAAGVVTVAENESKTCVITNDDHVDPPMTYLTLVKQVINDDGGTLGVHDFPLFIDGQQVTSGVAVQVAPGTYTASEQNQPGYTAGSWGGDCAANGSVTLAEGGNKTCTIVNDDEPQDLDQGCTPGYWKNHTDSWQAYSPSQPVTSAFANASAYSSVASASLHEALNFGGGAGVDGAARNLLRAATASLLNATHSGVGFPLTADGVVGGTNAALASGDRATMLSLATDLDNNNNLGCPLN